MQLGQYQTAKYPFFLCLWNSRAKNDDWILELWPKQV